MNTIKYYENIALSNTDLIKMLDKKATVVIYPDLIDYKDIDEVLGKYGACFLLFEAKPKYGHWVCLFKRNENTIEFFNSYGGWPDDSLNHIPMHFREISNQLYPMLSLLILNSPYNLEYNEFQFQKVNKNIKSCGRWCVVRLLLRDLDIYQFNELINLMKNETKLNGDELVTLLTI